MVKDPLYRAIEKRLAEKLDPALFERCAVDLLRDVYPGLVPIPGAGDGGMDGAISVPGGGHPIPLVTTTREDVIGNLTKNLKSYRRTGGSAQECILATSQALTPLKRKNLDKRATELGFVLRNIHDHADFVGRLYKNPAARKDLLPGLTGDPPALSAMPRSPRPWPAQQLLGRDDELAWLRQTQQDVVISGQPGVGKTALLATLAQEGHGLFVVSDDLGLIADAYRKLDPDWIFVDDAHLDAATSRDSLLGKLSRLRRELDMRFRIMATTWPGHENDVRHALYLPRNQVRRVDPLERSVMADIVRGVNPRFTDVLIGEILDQSDGRPGLAVTLAQWAQRGDLKDLVNGRLLLREVRKDLPGERTLNALAPFALAGRCGMRLPSAAQALEWREDALREALRPVSGTGVLREADDDDPHRRFIGVEPEVLRVALVDRAYFSGVLGMPVEPALEQVEDPDPCTQTLIQVLARGGRVPHALIRKRLEELHPFSWPGDLWEHYVGTGREAARWVLETHGERIVSVGRTALEIAPDVALEALLNASAKGSQGTDDPTPIVDKWVRSGLPGQGAAQRRILLVERLAEHVRSVPEPCKELWTDRQHSPMDLIRAAFVLRASAWVQNPVDHLSVRTISGSLLGNEVRDLALVWPKALKALRRFGDEGVRCARQIVEEWTGRHLEHAHHPETRPAAEEAAPGMLQDLVELADGAPGIVMWARRQARNRKLEADLPPLEDPLLDKLFPDADDPWENSYVTEVVLPTASDLATQWFQEDPQAVASRMAYYERQRELADPLYPNVLGYLTGSLAQQVDQPLQWLAALVDQKVPTGWVEPFLEAAVADSPDSDTPWEMVTRDTRYDWVCADVGLRLPRIPERSMGHVLSAIRRVAVIRHEMLPWADLSREWQCRLLGDNDARLRAVAATALWRVHSGIHPGGRLGQLLWNAVIDSGDPALLQELLQTDRMAAREWILRQARASSTQRSSEEAVSVSESTEPHLTPSTFSLAALSQWRVVELLAAAVSVLTIEDRRDLILAIPSRADERFFKHLVCEDPGLYRVLLQRPLSRQSHLAPLTVGHLENRDDLVQLAREHGYSDCDFAGPIGNPPQELLASQGSGRFPVS